MGKAEHMDQRQHVRKAVSSNAFFADALGKNWSTVSLFDISIGGAAFGTSERVIVDTIRTLKFSLPDCPKEIQVSAKVVNRAQAGNGFRVGVTFVKIDADAVAAIRQYVEAATN